MPRVGASWAAGAASLTGLAGACFFLFACSAPIGWVGAATITVPSRVTAGLPAKLEGVVADSSLTLRWASTEYTLRGPAGAALAIRIVLGNRAPEASESTSIGWEPSFERAFSPILSEPAAWRVSRDAAGWGMLDTEGAQPDGDTTFTIWFAARDGSEQVAEVAPRVRIVANGGRVIGEARANPAHDPERMRLARQTAFDRGLRAEVADKIWPVPADARGFFRVGVALGVVVMGVVLVGGVAALRLV